MIADASWFSIQTTITCEIPAGAGVGVEAGVAVGLGVRAGVGLGVSSGVGTGVDRRVGVRVGGGGGEGVGRIVSVGVGGGVATGVEDGNPTELPAGVGVVNASVGIADAAGTPPSDGSDADFDETGDGANWEPQAANSMAVNARINEPTGSRFILASP